MSVDLPDTITTWIATGFAMNSQTGFGIAESVSVKDSFLQYIECIGVFLGSSNRNHYRLVLVAYCFIFHNRSKITNGLNAMVCN